jgi:hypothetical protein
MSEMLGQIIHDLLDFGWGSRGASCHHRVYHGFPFGLGHFVGGDDFDSVALVAAASLHDFFSWAVG